MPSGSQTFADAGSPEFAKIAEIEATMERSWESEYNPALLRALRDPWRSSVLPTLRHRVQNAEQPLEGYGTRLRQGMQILEELFYALHRGADFDDPNSPTRPRGFWTHQRFHLFSLQDATRGIDIGKDELASAAAHYLAQPQLCTCKLDWIFLDALIFFELEAFAHFCFTTTAEGSIRWAAIWAPREPVKYQALILLFWVLRVVAWLAIPIGAGVAFAHDQYTTAAAVVVGLWGLAFLWRILTWPFRFRVQRQNRKRLGHLLTLYNLLGESTISPRRLQEVLDEATASGVVLDGAVFTILDRIMVRDPTALIPSRVG